MQVAGDVKKRAKDDTEKTKKALADAKAKADKVGRGGAGGEARAGTAATNYSVDIGTMRMRWLTRRG